MEDAMNTFDQVNHLVRLSPDTHHADMMKSIAKARLRRQVLTDPSLAQKLVSVEASPVYNARGSLIQAVSSRAITAS
jgi:hypothetical protein